MKRIIAIGGGEIQKQIPVLKIPDLYKPFLNQFVEIIPDIFGNNLHSMYICGSIAKGTARPDFSDADFTLVFNSAPSKEQLEVLEQKKEILLSVYPFIVQIDTPVTYVNDVLTSVYEWGYWIKIICHCVYGEDLGKSIPPLLPCRELVLGLNSDTGKVIKDYLDNFTLEKDDESNFRNQKKLAKRVLRALYSLLMEHNSYWTDNIEEMKEILYKNFPSRKADISCLYRAVNDLSFPKEVVRQHAISAINFFNSRLKGIF